MLSGANTFTPITADQTSNAGDPVSNLISGMVTDVDAGAFDGIAILGLNSSTGTWQYSTNDGGTWSGVGTVATNSALLLRSNDKLRLAPGGPAGGGSSITFRAWDQTSGNAGGKVDCGTNGGTTSFSTATASSAIAVSAGAFSKLQILMPGEAAAPGTPSGRSGTPAGQTAGQVFTVEIRAVDANWNVIATNDTVAFTSSDPNATVPANVQLSAGGASFSVTLRTAGPRTLTATDVSNAGIEPHTSASVGVAPTAAARLAFATQPASANAGSAFAQQPVVVTQDQYGNVSTAGLPTSLIVTGTLSAGTGPLQGAVTLDIGTGAGNGTVGFADLRIDPAGSKQLAASASGLTAALSDTFSVANVAPVAGTASFSRPRNVTLKILVSDLLTNVTDLNGDTPRLVSVSATSTNGATLRTNAAYVLYSLPPGGNVEDRFIYTVGDGTTNATGIVHITLRPASTGTNLNIVAYGLEDGKPRITFAGVPGHAYTVQRTQDIAGTPSWSGLVTTNAPAAGLFQFIDQTPPTGNVFYRAINE